MQSPVIKVRIIKTSDYEFQQYKQFDNLQDAIEYCWNNILWDKEIIVTKPRVHTYDNINNPKECHDEYDYDLQIVDSYD